MSEVKAPERLRLKFCTGCGKDDRFLPFADSHWSSLEGSKCPGEVVHVEYVPATDSPDREPDAWLCGVCLSTTVDEDMRDHHDATRNHGAMLPLYRNPPDRSDGLREALEGLLEEADAWRDFTAQRQTLLFRLFSRKFWRQAEAHTERYEKALAAARLALKARAVLPQPSEGE